MSKPTGIYEALQGENDGTSYRYLSSCPNHGYIPRGQDLEPSCDNSSKMAKGRPYVPKSSNPSISPHVNHLREIRSPLPKGLPALIPHRIENRMKSMNDKVRDFFSCMLAMAIVSEWEQGLAIKVLEVRELICLGR